MQIPVTVLEQIKESEKSKKKEELLKKKHVLLLALSTLRINKEKEVVKSTLECEGEIIGEYYYQLEPVILYMKNKNIRIDYVMILSTAETSKNREFIVEGDQRNESAESYFREFIKNELGDNTEVISMPEKSSDVETVKTVISKLRSIKKSEKDISLSIDIHGGFRNTQMLIQSIITLLQYEDILPSEIYSVSYNDESRTGSVLSANNTYDINNYVAGMSEFLSYGRSRSLELYYSGRDKKFINLIKEISDAIQLCQIVRFDSAINRMKDYINSYSEKGDYNDLFISSIKASYGKLMFKKGKNAVINKVKWCVDNDFVQQALTIIESQMPDEFIKRQIISYKTDKGRVKLYQKEKWGKLKEIVGGINLKRALEKAKPEWEEAINYSLIPWIRENCCEKEKDDKGKEKYIERVRILGGDENKYYDLEIEDDCLSKYCIIKNVDDNHNVIKLEFLVNNDIKADDKKDLARLLSLHLALKTERNNTNHASSNSDATLSEVKTAIYAYINLAEKVFNALKKKNAEKK